MHYAFTPELESSPTPGAITRGTHFYSWSRLSDTLRCLWRLRLTDHSTTNADHPTKWSLLGRMLLDVCVDAEGGQADAELPSASDIGALLVLILRHEELGFDPDYDPIVTAAMRMHVIRAQGFLQYVEANMPHAYQAWLRQDSCLSYWIEHDTDVDPEVSHES
jgi:hypothetical protein